MHLMTFLAIRKPGILMRTLILGAQGVFYNMFCKCSVSMKCQRLTHFHLHLVLSYLISPRICHRFVGYLEEEAVKT